MLTGITLNTDNVKKSYAHNETLDLTGLVVTANYNDNSSETVTDFTTDVADGATLNVAGNKTITVTYQGKTNSFDVVVNKTLKSIAINTDNVKKVFNHNEVLDLTGLVVTATYSDDSTADVTDYTTNPINGATLDTCGDKTIAVTYGDKTKTFDITVNPVLTGLTLDTDNV